MLKKDQHRLQEMTNLKLSGATYAVIGARFGISRQRVAQSLAPPYAIRRTVVARAAGKCETCGINCATNGHIHHRGQKIDLYNDIESLQLLCPHCHRVAHSARGKRALARANRDVTTIALSPDLSARLRLLRGAAETYEAVILRLITRNSVQTPPQTP